MLDEKKRDENKRNSNPQQLYPPIGQLSHLPIPKQIAQRPATKNNTGQIYDQNYNPNSDDDHRLTIAAQQIL